MKNERIFIRFEGVGHDSKLYINEKQVGKHSRGYSVFCYEIRDFVKLNEENLVAVSVTNEPNLKRIPVVDKLFNIYGGIYSPVQLFSTPKTNISPTYYTSSCLFVKTKRVDQNKVKIELHTHISTSLNIDSVELRYTIKDEMNRIVFSGNEKAILNLKENIIEKLIEIENPILWNAKKNTYQYSVKVGL